MNDINRQQPVTNKQHARKVEQSIDWLDQTALSFTHGNCYPCKPQWSIEPMPVSYDGLFFITQGQGWVEYDNQRLEARPGDLFLTRQGQTVAAGHAPNNPITAWSVGFNLRCLGGVDPIQQSTWPMKLTLSDAQQAVLLARFEQFVQMFHQTTPVAALACRGEFFLLLADVFTLIETLPASQVTAHQASPNPQHSRLTQLLKHIEANLDQPLQVTQLARQVHVTPSHLAHLFRGELGMSPSDYVRHRRMTLAKTLLRSGDLSIASIGKQVGFDDPYHFSRVFRRATGLSPRVYRNASKHPF